MDNKTAYEAHLWDIIVGNRDKVSGVSGWFNSTADQIKPWMIEKWVVYVCVVILIQWHIRYRCCRACAIQCGKPGMKLRRIALNLLVFNIYYSSALHEMFPCIKGKPFCTSVGLILLDCLGISWFMQFLEMCRRQPCWQCLPSMGSSRHVDPTPLMDGKYYTDPTDEDTNDDGIDDDDCETATNTYMDITRDFMKTLGLWMAQSILVFFYICSLNDDSKSKLLETCHGVNWVCAVLLQLYVGDKQLGSSQNREFWFRLFEKGEKLKLLHPDLTYLVRNNKILSTLLKKTVDFPMPRFKIWWWIRWFFDGSINIGARYIIMFTFPIMLSREGPLDFVKDCLAVLFITTLDDGEQDESKTIDHMMIILKFRLYMDTLEREGDACNLTQNEIEYILEHDERFDRFTQNEEWLTILSKMLDTALKRYSQDDDEKEWYGEMVKKKTEMHQKREEKLKTIEKRKERSRRAQRKNSPG